MNLAPANRPQPKWHASALAVIPDAEQRRKRSTRDLDIPEKPAELSDETRAHLMVTPVANITFFKPPGLWRRLIQAWREAA